MVSLSPHFTCSEFSTFSQVCIPSEIYQPEIQSPFFTLVPQDKTVEKTWFDKRFKTVKRCRYTQFSIIGSKRLLLRLRQRIVLQWRSDLRTKTHGGTQLDLVYCGSVVGNVNFRSEETHLRPGVLPPDRRRSQRRKLPGMVSTGRTTRGRSDRKNDVESMFEKVVLLPSIWNHQRF